MDDLSYVRDSVRSTRAAIKSAQKTLRALSHHVADLDERLDVMERTAKEAKRDRSSERETIRA